MVPAASNTSLRSSDFTFFGYDDCATDLDAYLSDVWVRRGTLQAPTVEGAVFVPPIELAWGHFESALVTADGQPIPTALSHRRFGAFGNEVLGTLSRPVALQPERTVNDEVVYLGWLIDHFGHMLLESLARTWILKEIDPATKVVFHIQKPETFSDTSLHMLEPFGIPRDRILILTEQTRLRRVIVPEALYEISYAAHELMPQSYRDAAATIVTGIDQSDQPVYLSRRLLSSRYRPIVGEFELEEVFRENGILVVYPETMTFEDQIRLVNRHHDIFTSAGSAAYLPLFALRPPRIHTLTAGIPFHDYFLVPSALGAEAAFCNCFAGDNAPSLYYMPPVLEIDNLAGYLESRGLLKKRVRATLTARVRDFQPDYDESRIVASLRFLLHDKVLSPDVEAEAWTAAAASWPVAWMLARYYAFRERIQQDTGRVNDLIQQFIASVTTETTISRLAHYEPDVRSDFFRISRYCSLDTSLRLDEVLVERFAIDVAAEKARRNERRRARQAARPTRENGRNGKGETPQRDKRLIENEPGLDT